MLLKLEEMKISKTFIVALMLVSMICFSTVPAIGYGGGSVGNDTGDGEPPGWSQVNPGGGGSDGPAQGPNSGLLTVGTFVLFLCSLI